MSLKGLSSHWVFNAVSIGIPVVLIPVLIRRLGLDEYGVLALLQIAAAFITTFVDFGFVVSGAKQISADTSANKSKIVSALIVSHFLLLAFVCLGGGVLVALIHGFSTATIFVLVCLSVAAVYAPPSYAVIYFGGQFLYGVVGAFGRVLHGVVVFVFLEKGSGAEFYFASLSVVGVLSSVVMFLFLKNKGVRVSFLYADVPSILNCLRIGFSYFSQRVSTLIPSVGIPFVLAAVGAKSDIAIYAVVDKIRVFIWQAISPVLQSGANKLIKEQFSDRKNFRRTFIKTGCVVMAISLVSASGFVLFSKEILALIGGGALADATMPWRIASVGCVFATAAAFSGVVVFPLTGVSYRQSLFMNLFSVAAVSSLFLSFAYFGVSSAVVCLILVDICVFAFGAWRISKDSLV